MQYCTYLQFTVISVVACSMAMVPPRNHPADLPTLPPSFYLIHEIDLIARMLPIVPMRRLIMRYLLNDEQFQAFVSVINSNDGYVTLMRFRSQPKVINFISWLQNQVALSENMTRSHIEMQVARNGILAQFIQRLQSLGSVYDRIMATTEAQRLLAALERKGINITALDTWIRNLFVWSQPRFVVSISTASPLEQNSATVASGFPLTTDLI